MEMSEELKRNKREMEMKRRKDKLTLEEINNETTKHEEKLNELRNEKHQLFAKFKKVLTDDENRKNLQRQKDAAYVNVTFGSPSVSKPPPPPPMQLPIVSSAPILMGNTNNPPAPIPVPLHTPYFAQMQTTNVSSNSSTSVPTSFNHHRMNGRVPTPTSSTFAVPKTQPSQSIYSKPMPHHSSALTSIPPTIPTSSPIVPSSIQNPYLIQNDRHRLSYKRTLEQTSSPVTSIVSGVNTAHLPYLPNYKPGMHPPPPGSFPQLPSIVFHVLFKIYFQSFFFNRSACYAAANIGATSKYSVLPIIDELQSESISE